jgi:steroid delta-isomerase-like uncharacterized protein
MIVAPGAQAWYAEGDGTMSAPENSAVIHRLFQVFNEAAHAEGDVVPFAMVDQAQGLGALDEVLAADAQIYVPGTAGPMSREDYKRFLGQFYQAFPDLQVTIDDEIAGQDKVAARWTIRGQHQGDFQGLPATGKSITLTGIAIWRMVDGKAVEEWVEWDALGLMQQLGAIPAPAPSP